MDQAECDAGYDGCLQEFIFLSPLSEQSGDQQSPETKLFHYSGGDRCFDDVAAHMKCKSISLENKSIY